MIGDLSRTALTKTLLGANFHPKLMAQSKAGTHGCYIEVDGFFEPNNSRLQTLQEAESIGRVTIIGSYATPFSDTIFRSGNEEV